MKTAMKQSLEKEIHKPESNMKVVTDDIPKESSENNKLKSFITYVVDKGTSLVLSIAGLALFILFWSFVSKYTENDLPGPEATLTVLYEMLSDPFYDYGPNDKGIGLQLMVSLKTVLTGFLIGSLIAIPIGILMGVSKIYKLLFYPIVQLLKPVSPLAWFPIGLVVFKDTGMATIFIVNAY
jgi:nitrate/nitrite transport system permease protein